MQSLERARVSWEDIFALEGDPRDFRGEILRNGAEDFEGESASQWIFAVN